MFASAVLGGMVIGIAASIMFLVLGRILGISGILATLSTSLMQNFVHSRMARFEIMWRSFFVLGLLFGGAFLFIVQPSGWSPVASDNSITLLSIAGCLVGIGSRMGLGCTSGHGVCGVGRFSGRSILATLTFMVAAIVTAILMHKVTLK